MERLRIYVDFVQPSAVRELLRGRTREHELLFSPTPAVSVLAKAERDPVFDSADIAFGQPDTTSIAEAQNLKWIHISSSGITRYDTPEFRSLVAARGIVVTNSATVYAEPCAVHVLSFMLAQARHLPGSLGLRKENTTPEWQELRESSSTLRGETVVIVGYGAIGQRLTELLRPFGVQIVGYRRKPRGDEGVPMLTARELDEMLAMRADHIINILPDSPETRRFFGTARFAVLKPGAVFYNIGRGTTVDQDALVHALRSGRLRQAWLDVTDPEPLPEHHPLWSAPNCQITPHIAGGHHDEGLALVRHFLANLERYSRGEPMLDRVM